jgi:hypothetical protein
MTSDSARRILDLLEAEYRPFRDAAEKLGAEGLERPTPAGWTAKEMLAHIAFWDEASFAVITSMFRGQPLPEGWAFGSGYVPEDPWPRADVHNAREAAWARPRPAAEVLARWDEVHRRLRETLRTITDEEAAEHSDYLNSEIPGRYSQHMDELEALLDSPKAAERRDG